MQTLRLKQLSAYLREFVMFGLGFFFIMTVRQHWEVKAATSTSILLDWVVFGVVTFALGAMPWPRTRTMAQVATGSFVASWALLAWVAWAVGALLAPYPVEVWPGYPKELLRWDVVRLALFGAVLAAAAFALSQRLMSRRDVRASGANAG